MKQIENIENAKRVCKSDFLKIENVDFKLKNSTFDIN